MTKLVVAGPFSAPEHALPGHPERPSRVDAAAAGLDDLALGTDRVDVDARPATVDELATVHDPAYLHQLEAFCAAGGGRLDPDTYAGRYSWDAACLTAGAGLSAIEALGRDEGERRVHRCAPARPPRAGGSRDGLLPRATTSRSRLRRWPTPGERVMIVDWDVHHGNGTEALFWDDDRVCYVSTHQDRFYPGTGAVDDTGGPGAPGLTVNIPLPAGATGDVAVRALEEVVGPVADQFAPTWVLVSAGFDAHRDDPLANLALSSGDFARLASVVQGFAPRGPPRVLPRGRLRPRRHPIVGGRDSRGGAGGGPGRRSTHRRRARRRRRCPRALRARTASRRLVTRH